MSAGKFKGWIPETYLDEAVPPCRPTPSDWLVFGDVVRLAGWDEDDAPDQVLADGETIAFCCRTEFGSFRVDWHGSRDFTPIDPVPAGATIFWVRGDADTIAGSVADILEYSIDKPGVLVLDVYHWSDGVSFVLRDGALVQVAPSGASAG